MDQPKVLVSRRKIISTGLSIAAMAVIGTEMARITIETGRGNDNKNLYPADNDYVPISLRWSIMSVQNGT